MRLDIQGLRAVAVLLVIVFHLWPDLLPGGYVGVDVFFVISGFLITGILLREHSASGTIDLVGFYARRMRRLVPAAAVVIIFVAMAVPILPATRWESTSRDIIASALFLENWLLAVRAVDYLALDDAPSVLQHYWSLGVEAQFYVFFPFLLLMALWLKKPAVALLGLGALFLALSVVFTYENPARSYFATDTRVWEFLAGGLVAATPPLRLHKAIATIGAAIGFGLIVWSAFAYSPATLFPGWAALAPCLGAVLILALSNSLVSDGLATQPWVFLGDISYAMYLWHWPLIVFSGLLFGDIYGIDGKFTIIMLSVMLATLSKFYVEDPIRRKRALSWAAQTLVIGGSFAFAVAALAIIPLNMVVRAAPSPERMVEFHPGAMALTGEVRMAELNLPPFIPELSLAKRDHSETVLEGCLVFQDSTTLKTCEFGDPNGRIHIAVVGDSHADQFSDAFKLIAERNGWRYTHLAKAQCPFADVTIAIGPKPYENCALWNKLALVELKTLRPEFVFVSQSWRYSVFGELDPPKNYALMEAGLIRRWNELRQDDMRVIAIRDIPTFATAPAECLAQERTDCDIVRKNVLREDQPLTNAAMRAGIPIIDLTEGICGPETCEPVVGNILAWRDTNHLTATFVKTMTSMIERAAKIAMLDAEKAEPVGSQTSP